MAIYKIIKQTLQAIWRDLAFLTRSFRLVEIKHLKYTFKCLLFYCTLSISMISLQNISLHVCISLQHFNTLVYISITWFMQHFNHFFCLLSIFWFLIIKKEKSKLTLTLMSTKSNEHFIFLTWIYPMFRFISKLVHI